MTEDHLTKTNASSKPVTLASLTEELLAARDLARTLNDPDSMNSATEGLMNPHVLSVGKSEHEESFSDEMMAIVFELLPDTTGLPPQREGSPNVVSIKSGDRRKSS